MSVKGTVININAFGATVRLETGELASAPERDVELHRAEYERAFTGRKVLQFERKIANRAIVELQPQIHDAELDEKITLYLKSTEEWDLDVDGVPTAERHFLKKKQTAARHPERSRGTA